MMKITPNDVIISEKSVVDLFHDGIKAEATRYDYTNKLKKVLCEYLGDILHGDPEKVEYQKNHPNPPKKGIKRQFLDADWEQRAIELVDLAQNEPKTVEAILLALVKKLKQRNQLLKNDSNYLTSSHINHTLKPIKKLFDMNGVPFTWNRINAVFPESETYMDYEEYSITDIKKLLDYADVITKVIVLLWSGSGIRPGGYYFKWKHRARSSRVISGSIRYNVLTRAMHRCELCGINAEDKALDVDHIVPINKGGPNVIENMQALCYTCNSQKIS